MRRALWRTAEILRAENAVLEALVRTPTPQLALPLLRALPLALQRRQIHAWLRARGVPEVGFEEVERVRSLLDRPRAEGNLPGTWHARRRTGVLFLERG